MNVCAEDTRKQPGTEAGFGGGPELLGGAPAQASPQFALAGAGEAGQRLCPFWEDEEHFLNLSFWEIQPRFLGRPFFDMSKPTFFDAPTPKVQL